MTKTEITTVITAGLIGGTCGFFLQSYWTGLIVTVVLTIALHMIIGSVDAEEGE